MAHDFTKLFARLFEVRGRQVLVTVDFEDEDAVIQFTLWSPFDAQMNVRVTFGPRGGGAPSPDYLVARDEGIASMLTDMTEARVDELLEKHGVWAVLEKGEFPEDYDHVEIEFDNGVTLSNR